MLMKNGGVLLPAPRSNASIQPLRFPFGLHRLLNQVLFISPLFWFMELAQNKLYLLATDRYGWGYEPDAHGVLTAWYSFRSLLPWVITVAAFSLLDSLLFERWRLSLIVRVLIAGTVGLIGEWTIGLTFDRVLGHCLQIWPQSRFVYVSPSALPFWCFDYVVFHWLTRELRFAQNHRAAQG
jgi:hypothetical protein